MNTRSLTAPLAVALAVLVVAPTPARSELLNLPPHPRIIVFGTATSPTRLEELRSQVDEVGDPTLWSERKKALVLAFRSLRAGSWIWSRTDVEAEWESPPLNQDEQYVCLSTLALTDLLMKNKGSVYPEYEGGRIYAAKADAFLHWWHDHGDLNWGQNPDLSATPNELGYAELLAGHALFYDWCYDYLNTRERAYHARAIYHLLTDTNSLAGYWRAGWYDNNHLGVVWGAIGLAALALDQNDPVFSAAARDSITWFRQKAASRVSDYLDASFPGEGAGIEGLLYAMYGLHLALPYALATDRLSIAGAGYDALPSNERVGASHNAFQVPTWLYYEQLPFNPCGGAPLNATAVPPWDMNPSDRAWPWLMAFSTSASPNLAVPFFYTIYTPAMIDGAVRTAFTCQDPNPDNDPFDIRQVAVPDPVCSPSKLSSCGIILGWPETTPYPALDPATLPANKYFSGRGITYFRTGIQRVKPDGTLDWKPDSCYITFECRQPPTYPPGFTRWTGHVQQDVNHFTVFLAGQPLFYDSGYSGVGGYPKPSFYVIAHNLHEIRIGTGYWHGFGSANTFTGQALPSVIGFANAPSTAGGVNTACWVATDVTRSLRRMVVLSRPGRSAPYFFLYDDFRLAASGKVRAVMQTGNAYVGGTTNAPVIAGNTARWDKGNARAVLSFLAPANMILANVTLTPNDPVNWPAHWVVRAEVPLADTLQQIVSLVEPRMTADGSPELRTACVAIATSDAQGLAYQVQSGRFTDVVAFRPADHEGQDWTIYPVGYAAIGANGATVAAVRFDGAGKSIESMHSALMSGRGGLCYDGQLVAACYSESTVAISVSRDGVAISTADGNIPPYSLGPFHPQEAIVNGAPAPVQMLSLSGGAGCAAVPTDGPGSSPNGNPNAGAAPARPVVPNPLRKGALIECAGSMSSAVVEIYDVRGRLLRVIHGGDEHGLRIRWDGRGSSGRDLPNGVYMVRIRQGNASWSRTTLFLR